MNVKGTSPGFVPNDKKADNMENIETFDELKRWARRREIIWAIHNVPMKIERWLELWRKYREGVK